jgi:hypothetical protein
MVRRPLLLSTIFGLAALAMPAAHAAGPAPEQLYGSGIDFEIRRNGTPVGAETVRITGTGPVLTVTIHADIAVKAVLIPLYHFTYDSTSEWRDGKPVQIQAVTNDDGKTTEVTARLNGDKVDIDGPAGRLETPAPLYATEHWSQAELGQATLLNTVTGKLDKMTVVDRGPGTVTTMEGPRQAHRYDVAGGVRFTAWYDAQGRWVGLRFLGNDGSTIDYICRQCGDASDGIAAQ